VGLSFLGLPGKREAFNAPVSFTSRYLQHKRLTAHNYNICRFLHYLVEL